MTKTTTKTDRMIRKEYERGRTIEQIVREMTEAGCGAQEIASYLDVSLITYYDWLRRIGAKFSQQRTVSFSADEASVR